VLETTNWKIIMLHTKNILKKHVRIVFVVAGALLAHHNAIAVPTIPTVDLGSASGFAVLAGSAITIAAPVNSTTITGDIGSYPTASITGTENLILNGVNHGGDAVTQNAKKDLTAAYVDAASRTPTTSYAPVFDLGGSTLSSGIYFDPTSFGLTGILTLDGQGNANAVFIFQTGSALTTASGSKSNLINGAQACHVFWEIGSSATLGTDSAFAGNILALTSITLDTGATLDGRALAQNGAVSLDNNVITKSDCLDTTSVPDTGSTALLLGLGVVPLCAFRRSIRSRP
jgi:hypothetical protein